MVGLAAAPTPAVAADAASPTRAANYLVRNLPASSAGAAASMTAAMGLATTGECTYAPALRTLVKQIEKGAKAYLYPNKKLNQARAANLAIVVKSLGLNPKKFAGYNLISLVTKSLPADGRVGSADSAFSQSLGIVALKRAGATIPVTLLTKLLSMQAEDGAFGYSWGGTIYADPDTTALGILSLAAIGQLDPQLNSAVGWALDSQLPDGSWPNEYSPVDSTSLLASAVKVTGEDAAHAEALAWLGGQQLADGGFPSSLGDSTSNVMATANALYAITGSSLLDVSLNLSKCPKNPPKLPAATTSCTGVWVVVDRGNGQDTVRCATRHRTGIETLKSAGLKVGSDSSGFVNRVHSFPAVIDTTFSKYWGYWYASPNPDGTWGEWQSYEVGAAGSAPQQGDAEGWFYGPYSETAPLDLPPVGYETAPTPTITGTSKVGQTLTVDQGVWAPEPGKLAVQWYRSGKAISKATKSSYTLTKSDAGKQITVRVTASGSGLQTVARTSAATPKVAK